MAAPIRLNAERNLPAPLLPPRQSHQPRAEQEQGGGLRSIDGNHAQSRDP